MIQNEPNITTKRSLIVLAVGLGISCFGFLAPASWFGITLEQRKTTPLLLRSADELARLGGDSDRNNNPDWKDLLMTTGSSTEPIKMSEEDKKRLSDPNNLTASFSKNLYTVATYADKKGTLTEEEQKNLATSLIQGEAEKIVVVRYTVNDIRVAKENTPEVQKNYGNLLGKLLKQGVDAKITVEDLDILKAYQESQDPTILKAFIIKKNTTNTIITSLLSMSVPSSLVTYHLILINQLSLYVTLLDGFSQSQTDSLRSSIAFSNYPQTLEGITNAVTNIAFYFKQTHITYTKAEPGYLLTSIYIR